MTDFFGISVEPSELFCGENSCNLCGKIPSGLAMIVTCIIVRAQKLINNVQELSSAGTKYLYFL